jgi:hypothetical protein
MQLGPLQFQEISYSNPEHTIQRKKLDLYIWNCKLAQTFRIFTRSLQANSGTLPQARLRPCIYQHGLPVHYSPPVSTFNASVLLTSLNKSKHTVSSQITFLFQTRRSQVRCLLRFPSNILITPTLPDRPAAHITDSPNPHWNYLNIPTWHY